jgi:hypothetical protein
MTSGGGEMEFLVADLSDDHPEQQVSLRSANPGSAQIRAALLSNAPIHYGTHFILRGSAGEFAAICTSGPYAAPRTPGEFLLYIDGELVAERASRERALDHILQGLAS